MPSSEHALVEARRGRAASVRPSEPVRRAVGGLAEVDRSLRVGRGRSGIADVADPGARRHAGDVGDGEQLGRSAVETGAGRPDPDGDRQRGVGDALRAAAPSSSSPTTAPRVLTCRISACDPLSAALRRWRPRWRRRRSCRTARSPGARRPGPRRRPAADDGVTAPGGVVAPAPAPPTSASSARPPTAVSRPIASLRTDGSESWWAARWWRSGRERSAVRTDPLAVLSAARVTDRGGQGRRRQDHGNGGARPCGGRGRSAGAGRRARRQAGARRAGAATSRALELSAPAALDEYLREHGFGRVARRLASSGVIDVVATAAPGHRRHRGARQGQAARTQRRVGHDRGRRPGRRPRGHVPDVGGRACTTPSAAVRCGRRPTRCWRCSRDHDGVRSCW